jgi:hypothetical protein
MMGAPLTVRFAQRFYRFGQPLLPQDAVTQSFPFRSVFGQ